MDSTQSTINHIYNKSNKTTKTNSALEQMCGPKIYQLLTKASPQSLQITKHRETFKLIILTRLAYIANG